MVCLSTVKEDDKEKINRHDLGLLTMTEMRATLKNIYIQDIFALGATNAVAVEGDEAVTNREGKVFRILVSP